MKWTTAVALFTVFSFFSFAHAQTGATLLLKPLVDEDETIEARVDALFLNNGSTSNDGADFQLTVYEASGRFRERRENFVPRVGFDFTLLDLDTADASLPDELFDQSIAVGLELGKLDKWRVAFTAGLGYAGPTPFGDGEAWYGMGTLVIGRKLNEYTDVAFVLDYNGNRTIFPDIPLPGLEFRHEFDPKLSYVIGLPVSSVTWRPTDPIRVEATYTLINRFDARVDYEVVPQFTVFGNFETRQNAFHVEGITDNDHDRLLFEQRRAEAGVQWKPREFTRLTAALGYAFSGEFSTGWDTRETDEVADISDEPYVRFGFETRF